MSLTRQEKSDAQAIFAAGEACEHCGGIHKRACPRVKRKAFHGNGNVIEVEYFEIKFDAQTRRSCGPRMRSTLRTRRLPVDDEGDAPEVPEPHAPFTLEDGVYAAIVSEYVGLQRAGADMMGAALITAAHLLFMGLANSAAQQQPDGPEA